MASLFLRGLSDCVVDWSNSSHLLEIGRPFFVQLYFETNTFGLSGLVSWYALGNWRGQTCLLVFRGEGLPVFGGTLIWRGWSALWCVPVAVCIPLVVMVLSS